MTLDFCASITDFHKACLSFTLCMEAHREPERRPRSAVFATWRTKLKAEERVREVVVDGADQRGLAGQG
jgi:hypothetical protein